MLILFFPFFIYTKVNIVCVQMSEQVHQREVNIETLTLPHSANRSELNGTKPNGYQFLAKQRRVVSANTDFV